MMMMTLQTKKAMKILLMLAEGSAQTVPRSLNRVRSSGAGVGNGAGVAAIRVATTVVESVVACAAAADVIDGCLVLHHLALAFELFVKGEDGSLARVVHVASTTTAVGEGSSAAGGGGAAVSRVLSDGWSDGCHCVGFGVGCIGEFARWFSDK